MSAKGRFVIIIMIAILLSIMARSVSAQGASFIAGKKAVQYVRGNKADISPGTLPAINFTWISSPMGICGNDPCLLNSGFFETGYYYQEGWTAPHQYASSQQVGGTGYSLWIGSALNQWASYTFKVLYSYSASWWEAWLGTDVPYFRTDLNFQVGSQLSCGGEAYNSNVKIDVTCSNNQYRVGTNAWTGWLFVYQFPSFTPGGYCVKSTGTYSFRAYGPTQTCP